MYEGRNPPEEPPCDTCRVHLLDENREAASIYHQASGQVIAGGFGVIDLNFSSVKGLMDLYGIKDQKGTWEKVRRTWHVLQAEERKKREG